MKQSPIRDFNGVVDSDLLLKWGGAVLALVLMGLRGLAPLWGVPAENLPGLDTISLALANALGFAGAFILKHRNAPNGQQRPAQ